MSVPKMSHVVLENYHIRVDLLGCSSPTSVGFETRKPIAAAYQLLFKVARFLNVAIRQIAQSQTPVWELALEIFEVGVGLVANNFVTARGRA
jgi:hypothetical protein